MRATMWLKPDDLRRLPADPSSVEARAERLVGRRIIAVGAGTSGHVVHGPSVAIDGRDTLVALDGGGPGVERLDAVAGAAAACGAHVHLVAEKAPGEARSIFPLTVMVQRIALAFAEQLRDADPDVFGYDVPARKEAWTALAL
jgi:hypothetical protein